MAGKRKKRTDREYERFRAESDQRLLETYRRLGVRNLPPLPIGGETTSPEYRAFRAEADERLRGVYERLTGEDAG